MDILKIAMIGMTGVCLAIPLKSYKAEYGMLISLGTCVCIFIYLVTKLEIVVEYIGRIETVLNLDGGYIRLMLKMMGITYVAQFAAGKSVRMRAMVRSGARSSCLVRCPFFL